MTSQHDIVSRVYEYAYGIDTRDWALYRSIFCDEIFMDFSSYSGAPGAQMKADDWVAGVKPLFSGLDATQHTMTNPLVDINGDKARCRMYMQAEHIFNDADGDAFYTNGGYYDDQLICTDKGWLISEVKLTVWWRRGNASIMVQVRNKGSSAA